MDGLARRNLSNKKERLPSKINWLTVSFQVPGYLISRGSKLQPKIVHHNPENGRVRLYQGESVFCKIFAAKYCSADIFCTVQFSTHSVVRAKSWRMCVEFHPCAFRLSLKNAWVGARAVWKEALRNLQKLSLFS